MSFFGFSFLFPIVFLAIATLIVVQLVRGVAQWNQNNRSPILTVDAVVCAKRTGTSTHMHNDHMHHSTSYYATFQVDSGDRMEFSVPGREHGMLAEGDAGRLTFQGTRYLGFERQQ